MAKHLSAIEETGFDSWVGRLWRRWLPIPVFLLENSTNRETWQATVHGGCKESEAPWATNTFTTFFSGYIYIRSFSYSFPYGLSENMECSAMCYTGTCCLICLKCNCYHLLTPNSQAVPPTPPWQPSMCSTPVSLYFPKFKKRTEIKQALVPKTILSLSLSLTFTYNVSLSKNLIFPKLSLLI